MIRNKHWKIEVICSRNKEVIQKKYCTKALIRNLDADADTNADAGEGELFIYFV